MKRVLPYLAYALVVSMSAFGLWRLETLIDDRARDQRLERAADCERSLALRNINEENDVRLVQDIADAVIARGGHVDPSLIDDIASRVDARYDRLPPPADCDP